MHTWPNESQLTLVQWSVLNALGKENSSVHWSCWGMDCKSETAARSHTITMMGDKLHQNKANKEGRSAETGSEEDIFFNDNFSGQH